MSDYQSSELLLADPEADSPLRSDIFRTESFADEFEGDVVSETPDAFEDEFEEPEPFAEYEEPEAWVTGETDYEDEFEEPQPFAEYEEPEAWVTGEAEYEEPEVWPTGETEFEDEYEEPQSFSDYEEPEAAVGPAPEHEGFDEFEQFTGGKMTNRQRGSVPLEAFRACATGPQPGAVAMRKQWRSLTGRNAGIFNCRPTAFGKPSLHGEGRAIDLFANAHVERERREADAYVAWLVANAVEIQCATIIWNRRIWSWTRRKEGWRPYKRQNPHVDHVHVDLSREGAKTPSPLLSQPVPGMTPVGPAPTGLPPAAPPPISPTPSPLPSSPRPSSPPPPGYGGGGVPSLGKLVVRVPGRPVATYQFTKEDLLWTARLLKGEAGGRDDAGNRAVLWAMFNRFALFVRPDSPLSHGPYKTFTAFLRAYSTPLQPYLKNPAAVYAAIAAAQRNTRLAWRQDGTFLYQGSNARYRGKQIPRGQYAHHLELQQMPLDDPRLATARRLATAAMTGQVKNLVDLASEFANTATYWRRANPGRPGPSRDEWEKYNRELAARKRWKWIGERPGLEQYKRNTFFVDLRAVQLEPAKTVTITPA